MHSGGEFESCMDGILGGCSADLTGMFDILVADVPKFAGGVWGDNKSSEVRAGLAKPDSLYK